MICKQKIIYLRKIKCNIYHTCITSLAHICMKELYKQVGKTLLHSHDVLPTVGFDAFEFRTNSSSHDDKTEHDVTHKQKKSNQK
jgi:hypothetical protein